MFSFWVPSNQLLTAIGVKGRTPQCTSPSLKNLAGGEFRAYEALRKLRGDKFGKEQEGESGVQVAGGVPEQEVVEDEPGLELPKEACGEKTERGEGRSLQPGSTQGSPFHASSPSAPELPPSPAAGLGSRVPPCWPFQPVHTLPSLLPSLAPRLTLPFSSAGRSPPRTAAGAPAPSGPGRAGHDRGKQRRR